MSSATTDIEKLAQREYKYGFVTDIEQEYAPPGLNEEIIAFISHKKGEPQWMLDWRLRAFRHWQKMQEPNWAFIKYPPVDYQATSYYAAPKEKPGSLDEVDPKLLETYEKLRQFLEGLTLADLVDRDSPRLERTKTTTPTQIGASTA